VTPEIYNGNTPTASADGACQSHAAAHGLPNSSRFKALRCQVPFNLDGGTWYRVDGVPLLARADELDDNPVNWRTALNVRADGGHYDPINGAWTGGPRPGSCSINRCILTTTPWTSASSSDMGEVGTPTSAFDLFGGSTNTCNVQRALYCFED
jgi:hypothetical protein